MSILIASSCVDLRLSPAFNGKVVARWWLGGGGGEIDMLGCEKLWVKQFFDAFFDEVLCNNYDGDIRNINWCVPGKSIKDQEYYRRMLNQWVEDFLKEPADNVYDAGVEFSMSAPPSFSGKKLIFKKITW